MTSQPPNERPEQRITHHTLTSTSGDSTVLSQLVDLSNAIFDESSTPAFEAATKITNDLSTWQIKFSTPGAVILYATIPSSEDSSSQPRPAAYLFAVPRSHPELPYTTMHISLAGVSPLLRGTGVWKVLVDRLIEQMRSREWKTRECEPGVLTICTFPSRFVRMFEVLGKNGWEVVGWRREGQQVLMKLVV
ncbi:unnamed protein product [Zymoseptoria tritici ST99CH_1E4]|uniref:N-acetyltransferase domain-containing protein n=1 Tax=Zymoseptoria tritici ST99CH_1E4 TaxID=1276532 RepID=A0A2H1FPB3_ZYMTR|nr:unnamed protein product [Zymoseptoria tritici ST99CH_1E4]